MGFWTDVWVDAFRPQTIAVIVGLLIVLPILFVAAPDAKERRLSVTALAFLHLGFVFLAALFKHSDGGGYKDLRLAANILAVLVVVMLSVAVLFVTVLPRLRVRLPRILQDVLVGGASLIAVLGVASRAGYEISGLIATSAVVTVVFGFALQDTLGNLFAGLALQVDDSIKIGDWINVRDHSGRVTEIRWRYTAIETRNWETLVVPNSVLTKEHVLILGRRTDAPLQWRRWIRFNIDFRFQPSDVIRAVNDAVANIDIPNVASHPAPHCIMTGMEDSYCRYAVRYWLTSIADDDPTDSVVRTRIFFALKRVGLPLSLPAHAVFMTKESAGRKARKIEQDDERRREAIMQAELFVTLTDEDRAHLARSLRYTPFTRGEIIIRQGSQAHWLYLVIEGNTSVRLIHADGSFEEIAQIGPGGIFGEMSLLTGAPRAATVVALEDVECYRLDKAAFQRIVEQRPEIAEHIAKILAERQENLQRAIQRSSTDHPLPDASTQRDLVGKIRDFFGIGDRTPPKR